MNLDLTKVEEKDLVDFFDAQEINYLIVKYNKRYAILLDPFIIEVVPGREYGSLMNFNDVDLFDSKLDALIHTYNLCFKINKNEQIDKHQDLPL